MEGMIARIIRAFVNAVHVVREMFCIKSEVE